MEPWKTDRVGAAIAGENPTVMARLSGGFAVIGDVQWLPGYSVLITDKPGVDRLTDLPRAERAAYLGSVEILAEAVEIACSELDPAFLRVNIEILGNRDPFLHTHIWPRYQWEEPELRSKPVWLYPGANWSDPATALSSAHEPYRSAIKAQIKNLTVPRPEILLDIDYGYTWPLSTIYWDPKDVPDWKRELPAQLYEDLKAWAKFFNDRADAETGMFGSETLRKHFDLEGVRLRDALEDVLGNKYRFRLRLWF